MCKILKLILEHVLKSYVIKGFMINFEGILQIVNFLKIKYKFINAKFIFSTSSKKTITFLDFYCLNFL